MTPAPPRRPAEAQASPFDVVFAQRGRSGAARLRGWYIQGVAWLAAASVHLALYSWAASGEPSLETWSARMAAQIHADLSARAPVAIEEAPPPEPPPTPEVPTSPTAPARPSPPVRAQQARRAPSRSREAEVSPGGGTESEGERAPPAQAGGIVAAESEPEAPVDFTDSFVTGTASAYVGGATARDGTSQTAVPRGAVDRQASATAHPGATGAGNGRSLSAPVGLNAERWRCAWPEDAVAGDIYEQFVVLRVVVRPDGSVERVRVEDDPGHGFARAAMNCARRTRFTPARDARGEPIAATSPPIRVRFTR